MPIIPDNVDRQAIAAFWQACIAALPALDLAGKKYALRCIGTTPEMNAAILGNIAAGQKVGTFPLPLQLEKMGEALPQPGDLTIQLTLDGKPKLLVRTTAVETMPFKSIGAEQTAIDGPSVRPIDVWRKIHIPYYTNILAGYGVTFTEDIPICVERFECVFVAP
jgi:uncharacterized protein YhfF